MLKQIEKESLGLNNNHLPHGVTSETYGLILFARDHKEMLDKVDLLDKEKRTINPTRNLIVVYYGTDASLRDVAKSTGGGRTANAKRILRGLETIWEQLPEEIQLQYPKEKAVRLKESSSVSFREREKRSKAAKTLWKNQSYREKTIEALRKRKDYPQFIARMQKISQGRPSPMEGKNHSGQSVAKITKATQENWNKRHGIEATDDPLAKRNALIAEWHQLSMLLGHLPSSKEITRLKRGGKTKFSVTMYKQEFGKGSFAKAREILTCINSIHDFATSILQNPSKILSRPILEKDIKPIQEAVMTELKSILSASSIEEMEEKAQALNSEIPAIKRRLNAKIPNLGLRIGEEEKSMWHYAIEHNLLPKILQAEMVTQQEIDLLKRYFENGIFGEKLTEGIFNRFTIAVAKIS